MTHKLLTPKRSRLLVIGSGPHALCTAIDMLSRGWLDVILVKQDDYSPKDKLSILDGGYCQQSSILQVRKGKELMSEAFMLLKLMPNIMFTLDLDIEFEQVNWYLAFSRYWHIKAYQAQQKKMIDKLLINIDTKRSGVVTEVCCRANRLESFLESVIVRLGGHVITASEVQAIRENEDGVVVDFLDINKQSFSQSALYCAVSMDASFRGLADRVRNKFYFNYSEQTVVSASDNTTILKKSKSLRTGNNEVIKRLQYNKSVTYEGYLPKNKSDYKAESVRKFYNNTLKINSRNGGLKPNNKFKIYNEIKWFSRDESKELEQFYLYRDKIDFYPIKRGGLITVCPNQTSTFRKTAEAVGDSILSDFGEEAESKTSERVFWSFTDA